jgi:hypothetical protein
MNLAREDPGLDRGVTVDERLRLGRVCGLEHDGRTRFAIERTGELRVERRSPMTQRVRIPPKLPPLD